MTSNIGSQFLTEGIDVGIAEERVLGALRDHFRPEFLNRVDEIVVFRRLDREQLDTIVGLQLGDLRRRIADRGLSIEVSPAAMHALAEEGYDPAYGARPLKRVIQKRIQDPLALRLLTGEFASGDTVVVDASSTGDLTFRRRPAV